MPDWLQAAITLAVTAVIIRAIVAVYARVTTPSPWDDPKLSESEREQAWLDHQI